MSSELGKITEYERDIIRTVRELVCPDISQIDGPKMDIIAAISVAAIKLKRDERNDAVRIYKDRTGNK